MSKTKEEYMELAYKDGLAGFFEQMNEQGTTDYGIFDGTVTKQIPECAITNMKRHDAKTLAIDAVYGNNGITFKNAVWPAGLEKEDLIGALVKITTYHGDNPMASSLCSIGVVEENMLDGHGLSAIHGNWYRLYLSYSVLNKVLTADYERSCGIVILDDEDNREACDEALTTYLDSLTPVSPDDPRKPQ